MRTTLELPETLLARVRRTMARRGVTLKSLVVEGLLRVLDEEESAQPRFKLEDASFKGKRGLLPGVSPSDVSRAIAEFNEGRWGQ